MHFRDSGNTFEMRYILSRTGAPTMDSTLNQCIAQLYQLAHHERSNFRQAALAQVQSIVPFDAGVWANGSHEPHRIHMSYVYNMSEKLLRLYNSSKVFVDQDFVRSAAVANPDHAVIVTDIYPRDVFEQMLTYKLLCRPFGIEQAIGIAHHDTRTGLMDFMALWRRSKTDAYTEQERQALELLWPHLLAADAMWLTHQLFDGTRSEVARYVGLFDEHGVLHVADAGMRDQLTHHWSAWQGPTLPEPLLALAKLAKQTGNLESLQLSSGVAYSVETYTCPIAGAAFKLHLRCDFEMAKLSKAEAKIAAPYAQGLTHKEIAKQLDLAPGTVRNHAQAILRKLGLRNKSELSAKLGKPPS
jgi:DNA-binding CsgD family transcriptional regulator